MSWAARSYGPRKRLRNSRVVRQPDRVQTRLLLLMLAAGVVVIVPLLANIWGRAEAVRLGYQIQASRAQKAVLDERTRVLRSEHALLRDLASIQRCATADLGLAPRRRDATVWVTEVGPDDREPAAPDARRAVMGAGVARTAAAGGPR